MKLTPSTRVRAFRPSLAALLFAALRLGLHVAEKQQALEAK